MLVQQTGSHHLALLPGTSLRPRTCAGKCHSCNAKSPNNFRPSSCSRRRPKKCPESPGSGEKKQVGASCSFLKIFHMYSKQTKGTVWFWLWKFQLFRNLALQDIEHLRRALKQRRNAEKERLGSKGVGSGWVSLPMICQKDR